MELSGIRKQRKIFIVAGEESGDLVASLLAKELVRLSRLDSAQGVDIYLVGLGGTRMQSANVHLIYKLVDLAVVGFTEVLKNIVSFKRLLKQIEYIFANEFISLVILVDYPGFNLRVAKIAQKYRIPVFYYISPQVWAWGSFKRRIKKIVSRVNKMLVILPFEETIYKNIISQVSDFSNTFSTSKFEVEFVGHPLLDIIPFEELSVNDSDRIKIEKYKLDISEPQNKPILCLLPGSRKKEIERHLPIMLTAVKLLLKKKPGVQFILPLARRDFESFVKYIVSKFMLSETVKIIMPEDKYKIQSFCKLAWVASGTATLELAILNVPMIVVYKVSLITYLLALLLVRTPYIGLVNIIAEKKIVPELIQYKFSPRALAQLTIKYLENNEQLMQIKQELKKIKDKLGTPGASSRAAGIILDFLKKENI